MNTPQNAYEATVLALSLALTAETEEKASECVHIAASLGLTEDEMERAKAEALKNINLFVFGEEKP